MTTTPIIPPGSTVLVTGINGLIAAHVADALLAAGYRVRGTVRSLARTAWVRPAFERRHGPDVVTSGRLQLAEVADSHAAGAWDQVLSDGRVAAVASVAAGGGTASLDVRDVPAAVAAEARAHVGLLEAAAAATGGSVRSFVLTSSAWAAYTPDASKSGVLTEDSWNDEAVSLAAAAGPAQPPPGLSGLMATKVGLERAAWDWVRAHRPPFAFCAVLPDTVFGPLHDAAAQGGSTAGLVRWLWEGRNLAAHAGMPPQWFVDARDLARLYVACLTLPGMDGRRVYGFAGRYSWPAVLDIMRSLRPDRTQWPDLPDAGWDRFDVPTDEAEALIRQVGDGRGWTSLEDSIRDTLESFLVKDKDGNTTLEAIKPAREAFA